jgi:hypothetical protein
MGPDVESRATLLELAKMTNNAYVEPDDPAWYDLGANWNDVRCCSHWSVGFTLRTPTAELSFRVGTRCGRISRARIRHTG